MSRQQRADRAAEAAKVKTASTKLDAILAKVAPDAQAGEPAPYLIRTLDDGTRQVRVMSPEGDVVGANGATVAEAVDRLCSKVGVEV